MSDTENTIVVDPSVHEDEVKEELKSQGKEDWDEGVLQNVARLVADDDEEPMRKEGYTRPLLKRSVSTSLKRMRS